MTNLRNKASYFKKENFITFVALLKSWLIITLVPCLARLENDRFETNLSSESVTETYQASWGKEQTKFKLTIVTGL